MLILSFRDDPPGRLYLQTETAATFSVPVDYLASVTLEEKRAALAAALAHGPLAAKMAELLLTE
jgi:hypothetical protein